MGAEEGGVGGGPVDVGSGNAEVDEVGTVCSDDDVPWAEVAMDDTARVKGAGRLADVHGEASGLGGAEAAGREDEFLERLAGDVVINDDEDVWQGVGGLHPGNARAIERGDGCPYALVGEGGRHLLAHEGSGAAEGDELGHSARAASQHALHAIRVIEVHGMHNLLVPHVTLLSLFACECVSCRRFSLSPGRPNGVTERLQTCGESRFDK